MDARPEKNLNQRMGISKFKHDWYTSHQKVFYNLRHFLGLLFNRLSISFNSFFTNLLKAGHFAKGVASGLEKEGQISERDLTQSRNYLIHRVGI